jgi:MerR family transcriptional regulator, redox-sensitive transcriptional activator SoxR
MNAHLSIGQIAQAAGVATSTLRYYESMGLLPKVERQSGQRRYDSSTIRNIGFIKLAQNAGFSIQEILVLLHGFPTETPPSKRWKELAEHKLVELDTQLERILEMKQTLEAGLKCGCLTIDECSPICTPQHPKR